MVFSPTIYAINTILLYILLCIKWVKLLYSFTAWVLIETTLERNDRFPYITCQALCNVSYSEPASKLFRAKRAVKEAISVLKIKLIAAECIITILSLLSFLQRTYVFAFLLCSRLFILPSDLLSNISKVRLDRNIIMLHVFAPYL